MFTVEAVLFPQPLIDGRAMILAIHAGLDKAAPEVATELEMPTSTWSHQVAMQIDSVAFTREIGTDDPIYNYVNNGTPEHLIPLAPKMVGRLRYAKGGTPKTQPGVLTAKSGSKGTDIRFAKQVTHPGIEPRLFDEVVADEWDRDDRLTNYIQNEIDKVLP